MLAQQTHLTNRQDGHLIFMRIWQPAGIVPQGVIRISHGMAEHSGRYAALAEFLAAAGLVVIAHDHRGHGLSIGSGVAGHYADANGWELVVSDMACVAEFIRGEFSRYPLFELGHSMGSFILQQYLISYQPAVAGVILSGSNYSSPYKYLAARPIAQLECLRQGRHGRSSLIRELSFGSFNQGFQPARTKFDWLTSVPEEVDKYLEDPLCGFDCTNQLWVDLLGGLADISRPSNLRRIPDVPILILGGALDPVSQQGEGLKKLAKILKSTGHAQVELKLYAQGRHEMFNEWNRTEVFCDLLHWLQQQPALKGGLESIPIP